MAAGIIAHRGASAKAPENTMAAFELARALGANGIETDIQLTSDGVPVLFHDHLAHKLGEPNHAIHDRPFEFWSQLKTPPPTLANVLELIDDEFVLLAEIKIARNSLDQHNRKLVQIVHNTLNEHNVLPHTRLLCFHPQVLDWSAQINPSLPCVLDIEQLPDPGDSESFSKLQGLSPSIDILEQTCHYAKNLNLELATWTVNNLKQLDIAQRCQADLILTDKPAWLIEQLS